MIITLLTDIYERLILYELKSMDWQRAVRAAAFWINWRGLEVKIPGRPESYTRGVLIGFMSPCLEGDACSCT